MRQIGIIPDEADAQRLADHLLTLGITTRLDPVPDGWALWIRREDQVAQARVELEAFRQNPADPRYQQAAAAAKALRKKEARVEREHAKQTRDLRELWGGRNYRRCPITFGVMAACLVVALWTNFGQNSQRIRPFLIATYELYPVSVVPPGGPVEGTIKGDVWIRSNLLRDLQRGEIWRLFTPALLHFGAIHFAFNMLWMFDLGTMIEIRQGRRRLIELILLTAVLSNLAQYYWDGSPRFGGMSGVVFGLFGYIWMKGMYEPQLGLALHPNTVMIMFMYLAFTLMGGLPFIAHAAHVGGLLVGVLLALGPHLMPEFRPRADE
jgi:GlpG protein